MTVMRKSASGRAVLLKPRDGPGICILGLGPKQTIRCKKPLGSPFVALPRRHSQFNAVSREQYGPSRDRQGLNGRKDEPGLPPKPDTRHAR